MLIGWLPRVASRPCHKSVPPLPRRLIRSTSCTIWIWYGLLSLNELYYMDMAPCSPPSFSFLPLPSPSFSPSFPFLFPFLPLPFPSFSPSFSFLFPFLLLPFPLPPLPSFQYIFLPRRWRCFPSWSWTPPPCLPPDPRPLIALDRWDACCMKAVANAGNRAKRLAMNVEGSDDAAYILPPVNICTVDSLCLHTCTPFPHPQYHRKTLRRSTSCWTNATTG